MGRSGGEEEKEERSGGRRRRVGGGGGGERKLVQRLGRFLRPQVSLATFCIGGSLMIEVGSLMWIHGLLHGFLWWVFSARAEYPFPVVSLRTTRSRTCSVCCFHVQVVCALLWGVRGAPLSRTCVVYWSVPVTSFSLPLRDLSLPFLEISLLFTGLSLPFFDLSLPFLWYDTGHTGVACVVSVYGVLVGRRSWAPGLTRGVSSPSNINNNNNRWVQIGVLCCGATTIMVGIRFFKAMKCGEHGRRRAACQSAVCARALACPRNTPPPAAARRRPLGLAGPQCSTMPGSPTPEPIGPGADDAHARGAGDDEERQKERLGYISDCVYLSFMTVPAASILCTVCFTASRCVPLASPRAHHPQAFPFTNKHVAHPAHHACLSSSAPRVCSFSVDARPDPSSSWHIYTSRTQRSRPMLRRSSAGAFNSTAPSTPARARACTTWSTVSNCRSCDVFFTAFP